jgi:hypothetical protein
MTTNGVQSFSVRRPARIVPFKQDFARRIDRVIDYFGAAPNRDHPGASRPRIRTGAAKARERCGDRSSRWPRAVRNAPS